MNNTSEIASVFVDVFPEVLSERTLYVSNLYQTAVHLCMCGCGLQVITPLGEGWWTLHEEDRGVSLRPSIGCFSFPCQSHYFISDSRVSWC